jgi:hypothetical protein
VLDAGRPVVVAVPLGAPAVRSALVRLARTRGAALRIVEHGVGARAGRRIARVGPRPAHSGTGRSTPRRAPLSWPT